MRFIALFIVAIALTITKVSAESDPIPREAFTAAYMAEAEARYPEFQFAQTGPGDIEYWADGEDDQVGTIFTDYAYQKYKVEPARLNEIIDHWVSSMPIGQEIDTKDARNRLVVVLRSTSYLEALPSEVRDQFVHRPFVGELHAMLMLDSPTALSGATTGLLEENNLSEEEAFILAEPNTRRLIGEIYRETTEGIELLESSNGLITALPWLPESCREGVPPTAMMLVDRELVMKVDMTGNPEAFDLFMYISTDMITKEESLASGVLMCMEGEWNFAFPNG